MDTQVHSSVVYKQNGNKMILVCLPFCPLLEVIAQKIWGETMRVISSSFLDAATHPSYSNLRRHAFTEGQPKPFREQGVQGTISTTKLWYPCKTCSHKLRSPTCHNLLASSKHQTPLCKPNIDAQQVKAFITHVPLHPRLKSGSYRSRYMNQKVTIE